MSYLLDTCVVSELMRPVPAASGSAWLDGYAHQPVFLSVLTVGEVAQGIAKRGESARKIALTDWLHNTVLPNYQGRILDVDGVVALRWGALYRRMEKYALASPEICALLSRSDRNPSSPEPRVPAPFNAPAQTR